MGRIRHKRKNNHVVIVTSDAVDAQVKQYRIKPWVLHLVIFLLCIIIGVMIGYIIYTLFALIVFGTGLAIVTSIQEYMIFGIVFGVVGIVLLICLIPMLKGLKD